MGRLQIYALVTGVFFGAWPLLMNRSGLSGNMASMVFSVFVFLFICPFAASGFGSIGNANWIMVTSAGALGAAGMLFFNAMLSKALPQNVGTLFVLMIVVQTSVAAIYHTAMNGGITFPKAVGFMLAVFAALLLTKNE